MILASFRPALSVGLCLLAALLILVTGNRLKPNGREAITITTAVLNAGLIFSMVPGVYSGTVYSAQLWQLSEGISLAFKTDSAGIIFACIASSLWIVTSFYSIGYVRGHQEKNQTGYFAAFAVCIGASMGIALAANLLTFFIFYEILTIGTYPLVTHYRDDKAKASGRKYLAYTLISGQLFFFAIVLVYAFYGSGEFVAGGFLGNLYLDASGNLISLSGTGLVPALLLFFMMICGGAVKAGVMPLHSWLPSAMVAPTPVSALLHAVAVVKAGAFCVLRIVCYVFGPELAQACGAAEILSWLAVCTIILSSFIAIRKDNLKARLAYSTVGQLSYIVLGISLLSVFSITGAIYHMVAHAFLKITLFMVAGSIFVHTGLAEISNMRGLAKKMPVTATCFTIASLGIAGLPLMAGFVSKFNIIRGALAVGRPLCAAVLVAAALLALTYLMPVVQMFFYKPSSPAEEAAVEAQTLAHDHGHGHAVPRTCSAAMTIPMVVTVTVALILGCYPNAFLHLYTLAQNAATAIMTGGGTYVL